MTDSESGELSLRRSVFQSSERGKGGVQDVLLVPEPTFFNFHLLVYIVFYIYSNSLQTSNEQINQD